MNEEIQSSNLERARMCSLPYLYTYPEVIKKVQKLQKTQKIILFFCTLKDK